ncbi:bifunctional homocysteine S-methyltransferase/methylenetetrahydrofolate reductase [bacterium]|nr:bifunctional homocysteine S-methyltransferase/methylenetetrahydrofolate reductase [bacterium]
MADVRSFLNRLQSGQVFLGDGAMGTQLYERGVYINRNYDELNLTDQHLVKAVHRDYVQSGAQVVETNTFGANPFKLGKHGLADRTWELNKTGAEIARRCADEGAGVLVAGSMGPLGKPLAPLGKITRDEALKGFRTQADGLITGGADIIMLETFMDLVEIRVAIQAVRSVSETIPIIAMMTVNEHGSTSYGLTAAEIGIALDREPVEVIGLNCSTGPLGILEAMKEIRPVTEKPLAAFPNAGEPKMVEGRIIYLSTPEYVAEYTKRLIQQGVGLIGGCCGTTPNHIRFMKSAIRALRPVHEKKVEISAEDRAATQVGRVPEEAHKVPPRAERSPLGKLLDDEAFPVSCELHPPRIPTPARILRQVSFLQAAGINVVNIPDGPRASARMSPMALAHIIKRESGMDTILHYTCRDRNILGMQSDLLGCEALGLDNILAVTGDPPKLGDYPMATAVFDVDAIGLLRIADNLNHSRDLAGNPIKKATNFFLGAGFNPGAIDLELEIDRLHQKIDAGAEYILTQPMFDQARFLEAKERWGDVRIPVLIGILPLASFRNAEFFHNEVPGMEVPREIRDRMKRASDRSKEHGFAEGIEIAQEALRNIAALVQGVYIMPPFGKVDLAVDTASILEGRITAEEARGRLERDEEESDDA